MKGKDNSAVLNPSFRTYSSLPVKASFRTERNRHSPPAADTVQSGDVASASAEAQSMEDTMSVFAALDVS